VATEAQHSQLIVQQLGATVWGAAAPDPNTSSVVLALTAAMPLLWAVARDKATANGTLPYYVKIEAIDLLCGQARTAVDADLGPLNIRASHIFRNLMDLRKVAHEEILRIEARASKSFRPAIGRIIAKAPVEVATPRVTVELADGVWRATIERVPIRPDPNDPAYVGDPLLRHPGAYDPSLPPR
jgi:hypothetical protein